MNLLGKVEYLFYLSQSSVLNISTYTFQMDDLAGLGSHHDVSLGQSFPNFKLFVWYIAFWLPYGWFQLFLELSFFLNTSIWLFGIDIFVNISDLLILCLCHWYYWFDLGNLILIRKALIKVFVLFVVHIWIIILYYILLIIFNVSFNFSFGIILVINRSASVYQS